VCDSKPTSANGTLVAKRKDERQTRGGRENREKRKAVEKRREYVNPRSRKSESEKKTKEGKKKPRKKRNGKTESLWEDEAKGIEHKLREKLKRT